MVTRAGKELLRNTIRTVDHHNRILEEQEMWRQWEREQGLTMMVSDNAIHAHSISAKARKSSHSHKRSREIGHRKAHNKSSGQKSSGQKSYWMKKLFEFEEKDPDRWGHSGYKELYPEEFQASGSSSSSCRNSSKNNKLIKRKSRKRKKQCKKHSKHYSVSATESSTERDSENDLVLHDIQNAKKHKPVEHIINKARHNSKPLFHSEDSAESNTISVNFKNKHRFQVSNEKKS